MLVGLGVDLHRSECRHLDRFPPEDDVDDANAPADQPCPPEQLLHRFRRRVGGDVEILRPKAQEQVAHAAAHDIGLEAGLLQPFAGLERGRRDGRVGEFQARRRIAAPARRRLAGRCGNHGRPLPAVAARAAKPIDELADHVSEARPSEATDGLAGSGVARRSASSVQGADPALVARLPAQAAKQTGPGIRRSVTCPRS